MVYEWLFGDGFGGVLETPYCVVSESVGGVDEWEEEVGVDDHLGGIRLCLDM